MKRGSFQLTLSHSDPEVLLSALESINTVLTEMPKVIAGGPTFIREAAVIEFYARGDQEVMDALTKLISEYAAHLPACSSLLAFTQPEPV